jgi:hypothetical protein
MSEKPKKRLTHDEILDLLSQRAAEGSITAAIALERAIRPSEREKPSVEDELDRITGRT